MQLIEKEGASTWSWPDHHRNLHCLRSLDISRGVQIADTSESFQLEYECSPSSVDCRGCRMQKGRQDGYLTSMRSSQGYHLEGDGGKGTKAGPGAAEGDGVRVGQGSHADIWVPGQPAGRSQGPAYRLEAAPGVELEQAARPASCSRTKKSSMRMFGFASAEGWGLICWKS